MNIGSQELLIILLLVFLFFGPRHLPEVARTLGKGLGDLQRTLRGVEDNVRRAGEEATSRDPAAALKTHLERDVLVVGAPAASPGGVIAAGGGEPSPVPPPVDAEADEDGVNPS